MEARQGACSVSVGEAVLISSKCRRPQQVGPGMSQDSALSTLSRGVAKHHMKVFLAEGSAFFHMMLCCFANSAFFLASRDGAELEALLAANSHRQHSSQKSPTPH